MSVYRGEIYLVDMGLDNRVGSEQKGKRPAVIIQNNVGNTHSTTTIVALLTSQEKRSKTKRTYPMHVPIVKEAVIGEQLEEDSLILCEQLFTVDKSRIRKRIGVIDPATDILGKVNEAVRVSLGLD